MNALMTRIRPALFGLAMLLLASCSSTSGLRYTYYEIEKFPIDIHENIRNKNVVIGMTPMQVRYALGAPNEARAVAPKEGTVAEEWTYKMQTQFKKVYVIFENNQVVKIQTDGLRFPTIRLEKVDNP